jgi:hypothetical protein
MPLTAILSAVFFGILVPAVVTAAGLWLALRMKHGAALAVAAGIGAGLLALAASAGLTAWQTSDPLVWGFLKPDRSWDWLPGLLALALVVGLIEQTLSLPVVLCWFLRLIVAGLSGWLLYRAELVYQSAEQPLESWWPLAIEGAVLILWGVLDYSARIHPTAWLTGSLTVVLFALAGVMELAGNMRLAQTAGVVGAVTLATTAVALWRPLPPIVRSVLPAIAVLLPGLLFANYFNNFASIPWYAYVLLLVAPLPLGAIGLPRRRSLALILLSVALNLILVALVVVLAARADTTGE